MFLGADNKSTGTEPTLGVPNPNADEDRKYLATAELPPSTNLHRPGR